MGYRSEWLKHEGLLSVHSEVFLHAIDRVFHDKASRVLLIGVGNGGVVEVWRKALPEGSTLVAVDGNKKVKKLDLGVHVGDVSDTEWLRELLRGHWFDVIIDATWANPAAAVWPFLIPGGAYVFEGYDMQEMQSLIADLDVDRDSWLPIEEVMTVMMMPNIAIVEKRNARVVPYLDVIVGTDAPVTPESWYEKRGAKRVTPV